MAFTEQEKQLILWGKQNGKTPQEVEQALARLRTGVAPKEVAVNTSVKEPSGFIAAVKDIPNDIGDAFKGSVAAVSRAMDTARDITGRVESGETSPLSGTLQTIGTGLRAGAETVGQGLLGIGKLFLPQQAEDTIGETVEGAAQKVVQTKPVQNLISAYQNLSPETQRNVQAVGESAEGLATAFGFGPIIGKLRGTISDSARLALEASDAALERSKRTAAQVPVPTVAKGKNLIDNLRFNLSEIDPQVDTILKRSTYNDVNRYFQQANNAKRDPGKDMPFSIANDHAQSAYNAINEARSSAVRGKKAILDNAATERVSGNVINDVMARGIQLLGERFGATINAQGTVTQAKGRTLKLDASDTKLVSDFFSRLNALGVSPTVMQVDDFVDWAQGQLYKQSQTLSKFEVASEPVVRELQNITGDLNARLKDAVGGGYGEVNARISHLIKLQDELSSALGADGRKGTSLMKRLFSPSGDETRRIFEEIRKETGIDLVKEATLAKFAMESVGDSRQTSLLKSLDVLKDANQLDLTKPMTIINFLREHADMDGQQLANEIIRRTSASK